MKTIRCPNPDCREGYIYLIERTKKGKKIKKKFCPFCGGHKYIYIKHS